VAFHSFLLERENFSKHGATSKSITKGLGAIERSADFEWLQKLLHLKPCYCIFCFFNCFFFIMSHEWIWIHM
jgi:hypothetical protein